MKQVLGAITAAAAMLAFPAPAAASPPRAVIVTMTFAEQSPERIVRGVVEPILKMAAHIAGVSVINSTANHGHCEVEISFESGAGEGELAVVTAQVEKILPELGLAVQESSIVLGTPRPAI